MNFDLESLVEWLKANRLSLNVNKSKLIIFRSNYKKEVFRNIFIKLDGTKLIPSKFVKYLGMYIDDTYIYLLN